MKEYQRLSYTRWGCKYHVVFIAKKRKKKDILGTAKASWKNIPRSGEAERVAGRGRTFDGESRAVLIKANNAYATEINNEFRMKSDILTLPGTIAQDIPSLCRYVAQNTTT